MNKAYQAFLASPEWAQTKAAHKDDHCYVCGATKDLHLHHLSYTLTYGTNPNALTHPLNLVTLCAVHHHKVHFSNRGRFFSDPDRISLRVMSLKKHWTKMQRIREERRRRTIEKVHALAS